MTGRQFSASSVRRLSSFVERIAPRDVTRWDAREKVPGAGGVPLQVSPERGRQLWMLVGMLDRAVARGTMPVGSERAAARLFTGPALAAFWELAEAGELRARAEDVGKPLPVASLRVVRDCLAIVASMVVPNRRVRLPVVEQPELKPVIDSRSQRALYRKLADLAARGPLQRDGLALSPEERDRLLAMVAIVLAAGTRSGELTAVRVDDLAPGATAVGVRRRQQKAPPNRAEEIAALAEVHPDSVRAILGGRLHQRSEATRQRVLAAVEQLPSLPDVEWYPLPEGSRVAVRRWLRTREAVIEASPLTGGRTGLWVTLAPSKAGPAGITLRPDGLRRSYRKGLTALNWVMAGERGWSPLPTSMEQLRRAVDAVPLQEPPVAGRGST
ncbi:hypothetical protein [Streptomyces wuyuanensis]|uniref:hypothetical protein n=1 Tax=Streptomyces wuyuanensis TaxID=1196353 RepID=UPI0036803921